MGLLPNLTTITKPKKRETQINKKNKYTYSMNIIFRVIFFLFFFRKMQLIVDYYYSRNSTLQKLPREVLCYMYKPLSAHNLLGHH